MFGVSFVCLSAGEKLKLLSSFLPGLGRHWAMSYDQTEKRIRIQLNKSSVVAVATKSIV